MPMTRAARALLVLSLATLVAPGLMGCLSPVTPTPAPAATPAIPFPLEDKTDPANRYLYLTVWSFQLGQPEEIRAYAELARELGFDAIGLVVTWERIQRDADAFSWDWVDAALDVVAEHDLKLSLGLMYWTAGLRWQDDLCLQRTPQGAVYEFDSLRGPGVCYNHAATLERVEQAMAALVEHTQAAHADRIVRYGAHFSAFGEVEYTPAGIALDYSPSEVAAFRAYLRRRPGGLEAFNRDYGLSLESWPALDALPVEEIVAISPYDWTHFRQQTLVGLNRIIQRAVHTHAPGVPVAMQVGSVWDVAAATQRGVFDAYLISRDVDMLHIDDAPGWPHDFSLDMAESLAVGRILSQELDGAQHAGALPDLYLRQAEMTGASGVTVMNTANWAPAQLRQWADPLLSRYRPLFLEGEVRPPAPEDRAILFNTADFITRMPPTAQDAALMGAYQYVSQGGSLRARFVTDSMLLDIPDLLDELTAGLYLGAGANMRFDPRVAELLAAYDGPLYVDGPGLPTLSGPFGHPLDADVEEALRERMRVME